MRKIENVMLKDGRNLKEVLELHKKWLEYEEGGEKVNLSCENLCNIDLSDVNLEGAILSYVNLNNSKLISANLEGVKLRGADLKSVNLKGVNLRRANLIDADLTGADLKEADLKEADLTDANLTDADLKGTDLTDVDLIGANLIGANLSYANLTGANLKGTNLKGVDLRGTNLTRSILIDVNLTDVKYNNATSSFALQCPEEGSFIGYKKANDKIVKLLITEDAKRSSATTRKCRCSKAKVLSITSLDGKENFKKVNSNHDIDFVYEVGKIVEVKNFDENRWNECSTGIHFFITRDEAVMY